MNEHSSRTRAEVPPSATDSLDPMCRSYGCGALKLIEKCVAADSECLNLAAQVAELQHDVTRLMAIATEYVNKRVAAPDQGSVRNATDELLREAVIAMAEDGWLYFGEEGMSEAQEKCLAAYKAIRALPDQKD